MSSSSGGGYVLPMYVAGGGRPFSPRVFSSGFRLREKYLILVGVIILVLICYSTFVFLPSADVAQAASLNKLNIQRQVVDAFNRPEQFVIPAPNWYKNGNGSESQLHRKHDMDRADDDPHVRRDEEALKQKIDEAQIPRPQDPRLNEAVKKRFGEEPSDTHVVGEGQPAAVDGEKLRVTKSAQGSNDPENDARREKIKQMMMYAWDGYSKYAWGSNELKPHSKRGHSGSVFGMHQLGASIIDGMDTLWIMGLKDRFEKGKKWVELSFQISNVKGDLSVFETNIRFVGGLLTLYALTKDRMFVDKAQSIADRLLPAFNTPTGVPMALVNMQTGNSKNWGWASAGASILSEFGTLHMEFEYLSVLTGKPVYAEKVHRIREVLNSLQRPDGLYPNYLNPKTGKWGTKHVSMGALGDSFYEYLLKSWIVTNKRDIEGKKMYDDAIEALEKHLILKSKGGLTYFAELRGSRVDHKMDHLACFSAGMFALQSRFEESDVKKTHFLQLGRELGRTCHESYARTGTGIGPESFRFSSDVEAKAMNDRDKYYILRPEVIEGWFYLWRETKEQKYRDWAWQAALAIEKHCKDDVGYAGVRNTDTGGVKDDVQQSFFLAETLKYLYLIFCDDDVMSLDEWVFNTEAHPIPVRREPHDVEVEILKKKKT